MSDDHNIESWDLHIEDGAANWVSRVIDHADKLKAERDAAEAKLEKAVDFCRRLERFADQSGDSFLLEKSREALAELKGQNDE